MDLKPLLERLKTMSSRINRISDRVGCWQPLTFRGFLAIGLSVAALHFFAINEYDLVAYILGGAMLAILAAVVIAALVNRLILGRALTAQLNFNLGENLSKQPVEAGILIGSASILPFFSLLVRRSFLHPGAKSPTHQLTGKSALRYMIDTVRLPHRGVWAVDALHFELNDSLGLTRLRWIKHSSDSVEVSAPAIAIQALPITASSSRAGDLQNQSHERSGDLFDIKQYDPSDGIKRILWKTFAHSGELVVRRPEPAILPEGELPIYLIADRRDDHVVGAMRSFIAQLAANQINILFGTDGMTKYETAKESEQTNGQNSSLGTSKRAPNFPHSQGFVTNPEEIIKVVNRSVWSESAATGRDFEHYLESLRDSDRVVSRIVVFAPERLSGWFEKIAAHAQNSSVALSIALVPESVSSFLTLAQKETAPVGWPPILHGLISHAKNYLANSLSKVWLFSKESQETSKEARRKLSTSITTSGAELIICQNAEFSELA